MHDLFFMVYRLVLIKPLFLVYFLRKQMLYYRLSAEYDNEVSIYLEAIAICITFLNEAHR